jgi:hypothetical protein
MIKRRLYLHQCDFYCIGPDKKPIRPCCIIQLNVSTREIKKVQIGPAPVVLKAPNPEEFFKELQRLAQET